MTLVIGAGLFVRSLVGLQNVDLGFKPDQLLTASVSPPRGAYRGEEALAALFDRMIARASQLPGVELASFTSILPLSGAQINFNLSIKGRPPGRAPGEYEPTGSPAAGWLHRLEQAAGASPGELVRHVHVVAARSGAGEPLPRWMPAEVAAALGRHRPASASAAAAARKLGLFRPQRFTDKRRKLSIR